MWSVARFSAPRAPPTWLLASGLFSWQPGAARCERDEAEEAADATSRTDGPFLARGSNASAWQAWRRAEE